MFWICPVLPIFIRAYNEGRTGFTWRRKKCQSFVISNYPLYCQLAHLDFWRCHKCFHKMAGKRLQTYKVAAITNHKCPFTARHVSKASSCHVFCATLNFIFPIFTPRDILSKNLGCRYPPFLCSKNASGFLIEKLKLNETRGRHIT